MSPASSSKFSDREWDVLLHSIERGNCIPLLGPDLSLGSGGGEKINLAIELSRVLAEILLEEKGIGVPDTHNLSLVAQMFQNHLSRDDLAMEIERFYDKHDSALANSQYTLFESLAVLPFSLFVTSRHDVTLSHYLEEAGKLPKSSGYQFKGDLEKNLGHLGTVHEPLIYRLYGSVDQPDSLVITENDQLEFLRAVVSGSPKIPDDLSNTFRDKNFLFLGFGLGNYHLRVLMHVLNFNKSTKSFALENPSLVEAKENFNETFKESVLFYSSIGYSALKLLDMQLDEFVHELRRRWEERHPAGSFEEKPPPMASGSNMETDAPSIFISYVKEDEEQAKALFARLNKEGLNPWIDTEGLRFGTRWNDTLEDTITKAVDYFVVLQSRALSDRVESYVHKEVKLALERQDLRAGRFIFPVQIDEDTERLEALERAKIQTGTLYDWDVDVPLLAREIKREHARRKRHSS